ncbi:DUF4279 domain-containing protein [Catellatospora vulcania]|uniref:DUF4279 domain-containing protein n=1 Tax=Catellatospora vulcania TaxID=1460450 RepID=UPI0012D497B5|nr:DUF4279 domain-containing protein [Catellatospora vulcania]
MRLSQHVYFALKSEEVTAAEMTARLGIEPDRVSVRGSRLAHAVVPRCHIWEVACREPDLTVDEQIDRVLERLLPAADRIAELTAGPGPAEERPIVGVLQVVRVFKPTEEGDEEPATSALQEPPEKRNLFGWHLDGRVLDFLRRTHAELDVDEYGH